MAKTLPQSRYARLRQLGGDRRLHITDTGHTTSGYLAEVNVQYTSGDATYLHLELEESEHDLFSDGIDAASVDIRVDRILAADVQALDFKAGRSWAWQELQRTLDSLAGLIQQGDRPPCEHEDVIETPQMGSTTVPGVCVWCPVPLVKLNDEWIPA